MKIDKRKNYGIILDTETANTLNTDTGGLDMSNVLPYDIGFAVIDTRGNIYQKHSYLIKEIFCDERNLMKTAYYAAKIPKYLQDIQEGKRVIKNAYEIRQIILNLIKLYECKFVIAYNMQFDLNALNNLIRWTTKSKYRYFFPYNLEIWDCMKLAQQTLVKRNSYKDFCYENNYLTKNGQCRKTVEILYKYLTGDENFAESHTGLEDVEIETEIFGFCVRAHKSVRKNLYNPETRTRQKAVKWWESVL